MAIPNSGRRAAENNQSLADLMNECEDFLHQMDSSSRQEQKRFNPLGSDSDDMMEFEGQPAVAMDEEGYENVQTEDVGFMGGGGSSRNKKTGKFASYLENSEPMLQSSPNLKKHAKLVESIENLEPEIKSAADDLDILIEQVTDYILMNQLPHPGNLRSHKKKDVKLRIKCFQALLLQKEKSFQTKNQWQEKVRRLEMDLEIQENKNAQLQRQVQQLDKQKYQTELKAKESAEKAKAVQ